jgi:transcriptional regulator with XRE-family HTH domain
MAGMISPRAPRDGDRSRRAPLPGSCRAIGAQLAATRDTRQISVEAAASKLLLSKGQIVGLEQGDPSPFYNTEFFLRGLRKYMALLDVPADLLVDDQNEEEGGLRLMLADMAPRRLVQPHGRPAPAMAVTAAVVLAAAAGGLFVAQSRWRAAPADNNDVISLAGTLLPAEPIRSPAEPPLPFKAQPAVASSSGDAAATIRVSVGKATWVFVKYPDNRVVERRLEAGEQMEVGPLPAYLAVGTADSVEVRVEDRPVALGPYIKNGQVRLTQPDLARLVP